MNFKNNCSKDESKVKKTQPIKKKQRMDKLED